MWKISVLAEGEEVFQDALYKNLSSAQVAVMNIWKKSVIYYIWNPKGKVIAMTYDDKGELRWGYTGNW